MNYMIERQVPRAYALPIRSRPRIKSKFKALAPLIFVILHAPLGLALKLVPHLSTLHALISLAVVLMLVIRKYPLGWTVAGCAYLVGSETLWRMTNAGVFWEFSKYAVLLVAVTALFLRRLRISTCLPVCYLALLVPGGLITMLSIGDLNDLRQALSFNLSGPAAYAGCGLFLFGRKQTFEDVQLGLTAMLAPIAGVAALTWFGIASTDFTFRTSSLVESSGGFGPNQVSAALALGMVTCFLLLTGERNISLWRWLLMSLIVWFGIQSALTFSRSGLYYAAASILAGTVFLVSDPRRFVSALVVGLGLVCLAWFVVLPRLDTFTGGALSARFDNKDLTGRGVLMENDLNLFMRHPVFGVGAGMGDESRAEARSESGELHSHTEFTRLLSEHGLLGVVALTLMLIISIKSVFFQTPGWPRAFSASLVAFALVFMTGSGMRLAIPSFLLAYAGVRISRLPLKSARASKSVAAFGNQTGRFCSK